MLRTTFKLDAFLKAHPEFEWQRELAADLPSGPWTIFTTTTGMVRGADSKPAGRIHANDDGIDITKRRRVPEDPRPPLPGDKRPPL
jgi:hypothetical protein